MICSVTQPEGGHLRVSLRVLPLTPPSLGISLWLLGGASGSQGYYVWKVVLGWKRKALVHPGSLCQVKRWPVLLTRPTQSHAPEGERMGGGTRTMRVERVRLGLRVHE